MARVLVLGGTAFVGRHIVEALREAGHTLTLFNRGRTNADLFPDLEKLQGDRDLKIDAGLSALDGRQWDVIVDVNGYVPRIVSASARLLKQARQYIYISTLSVYASPFPLNGDETIPLETIDDPTSEDIQAHYGALKRLCEVAAEAEFPGRSLSLRLGLVSGPYDRTDRATWWAWRASQGGAMLAPGQPGDAFQSIDARDIAAFVRHSIDLGLAGIFNLAGPASTWGAWIEAGRATTGAQLDLTWIDDHAWIEAHAPQEGRAMGAYPMALPPEAGHWWTASSARALAAGLRFRPIEETVRDTLAWAATRPADYAWRAGLSAEGEAELITAWQARERVG